MDEIINAYDLKNPEVALPMSRAKFYEDQIAAYKSGVAPTAAVEIIDIFLFTGDKELFIQKRSFHKAHNPGLFDKAVGGHVRHGDTPDFSAMVETVQELQTPSIVLRNQTDFIKTLSLLKEYLDTVAVLMHVGTEIAPIQKIFSGESIPIANKIQLYFGIYNGRTRSADHEAKGVLHYTFDELQQEMEKFPAAFTDDIHFLFGKYKKEMIAFLESSEKILGV
ncbi:MAG: hypothetical protein NUV53_03700 [Patescibacteria group bacterium]|nr:hypothetical protein [Patescibacteria group bacterium]